LYVARYVPGGVDGDVTVGLRRNGHVYDLRTGRYLGHGDSFRSAFPDGRMQCFAVLQYRATGLAAECSPAAVRPGGAVTLRCRLATDGPAADLHGFRVRVIGPGGADVDAYRQVVLAAGGETAVTIPTALNEAAGTYRVTVTDCISGRDAEAVFAVSGD
jgi:hypothetical protein